MKALRLPVPLPRQLIGFAAKYHANLLIRVLAEALPDGRRNRTGQDLWSAGDPLPAGASRGRIRGLPGSLAILPVPLPGSTTPAGPTPPGHSGDASAAPAAGTAKAPTITDISGLTTRLRHTLSTLQGRCHQAQARLACDWSAHLCRAGVEPAESLRKVSGHSHDLPPSQGFPWRYPAVLQRPAASRCRPILLPQCTIPATPAAAKSP
jgi:hypothetical protein